MPAQSRRRTTRSIIGSLLFAILLSLSTASAALAENEPDLPPPDPNYVPSAREEFNTSKEDSFVEPSCKPKRDTVCPLATVSNGTYSVTVTMYLGADDKSFHEYVQGNVTGWTSAA